MIIETKGLYLVRFSKGGVHKHFSVAVVEWLYAITWSKQKIDTHNLQTTEGCSCLKYEV